MHLEFDYNKCTSCGQCSKVCGSKVIEMGEDTRPFESVSIICNDCGHCESVCPKNAVKNSRMDDAQFEELIDPNISFDQYLALVRNRRSIRLYKKEPLSQDHIDKLLTSVRYIPTGSNKQSLKYLIITDPNVLKQISDAMNKKFTMVSKLIHLPLIRLFMKKEDKASMEQHDKLWKEGFDQMLRGAPCLVVIYSDAKYFGISSWDAGIATYNINLAAQTLGVGVLMNGFHSVTCGMFKSIRKASQIPKKGKVLASLCLGYPAIKYKRTVSRLPLDIKRI
jgi:nitroreductase/NAD-dependent dihydropyrimidine dehydrogenase PreA subunit